MNEVSPKELAAVIRKLQPVRTTLLSFELSTPVASEQLIVFAPAEAYVEKSKVFVAPAKINKLVGAVYKMSEIVTVTTASIVAVEEAV